MLRRSFSSAVAPTLARSYAEQKSLFFNGLLVEATSQAETYCAQYSAWPRSSDIVTQSDGRHVTFFCDQPRTVMSAPAGLACLALYPLMVWWPSGWTWHVGHSDYPMMIIGIYATLGVFLILAARDPLANLSLIWFTVWSSVVHGGIMAVLAVTQPGRMGHLAGDVPGLFIVAVALGIVTLRSRGDATYRTAA